MATVDTIHTHGYQHFGSLQLSSDEFYKTLETILKDYQYPEVQHRIEELKEGGWLSAKRKYFTISWQKHKYYVCASPFGKSFFISWWHEEGANTGAGIASKFGALGKAVASNMESKTFFEVDTTLMFLSCINSVIDQAIEKVKVDKGYTVEKPLLLN